MDIGSISKQNDSRNKIKDYHATLFPLFDNQSPDGPTAAFASFWCTCIWHSKFSLSTLVHLENGMGISTENRRVHL